MNKMLGIIGQCFCSHFEKLKGSFWEGAAWCFLTCSDTTCFSSLSSLLPPHLLCAFFSFVCFQSRTPLPTLACSSINFPVFLLLLLLLRLRSYLSLDDGAWLSTRHQVYFSKYSFFSPPLFSPCFFLCRGHSIQVQCGPAWRRFTGLLLKVASSQSETCTSQFCQIFYLYISFSLRCFRY